MADILSKDLVKALFQQKEIPRIPFIPWVCSFAAQLEQVSVEDMLSDPGTLSSSLLNAQELFGYDAIVSAFDTTLEAEACGCGVDWGEGGASPKVVSHPLGEGRTLESLGVAEIDKRGRIPVVLESTKRLKIVKGKQAAIIGVVTGPLTLAGHLKGDAFLADYNEGSGDAAKLIALTGSIAINLCRKYSEAGVDGMVIAEEGLWRISPDRLQVLAGPLKSTWNVLKFFNVYSVLLGGGCGEQHIAPALALQADALAVAANIDPVRLKEAAMSRRSCYGVSIPTSALLGDPSEVAPAIDGCLSARGKGFFLTTEWDVPYAANVNAVHEVMAVLGDSH